MKTLKQLREDPRVVSIDRIYGEDFKYEISLEYGWAVDGDFGWFTANTVAELNYEIDHLDRVPKCDYEWMYSKTYNELVADGELVLIKYTVNYTDPTTGVTSPIDNIEEVFGYTAEDYVNDCKDNADDEWNTMLANGKVELEEV